jgi:hypothetical protein
MSYDIQTGTINRGIRKEVVDALVKQTAEASYKFKQACAVVSTDSWKNSFFREDPTVLAGPTGNTVATGLPRGANFPQQTVKWEEVSVRIIKYGLEDNIPWEDIISGDINVQARTVIKLTEAVTKAVDDNIWDALTQTLGTGTNIRIQSYAITNQAYWNVSSGAIIKDVMTAASYISKKNYDISDLLCFVSPENKVDILSYLADKGAQFPQIAGDVVRTGQIGRISNVTFIESNSVPTSFALLVKPKTCATFKQLVPLQSTTVEDPYKSLKIRVVEEGTVELTDPLAICLIKNTRAT